MQKYRELYMINKELTKFQAYMKTKATKPKHKKENKSRSRKVIRKNEK